MSYTGTVGNCSGLKVNAHIGVTRGCNTCVVACTRGLDAAQESARYNRRHAPRNLRMKVRARSFDRQFPGVARPDQVGPCAGASNVNVSVCTDVLEGVASPADIGQRPLCMRSVLVRKVANSVRVGSLALYLSSLSSTVLTWSSVPSLASATYNAFVSAWPL